MKSLITHVKYMTRAPALGKYVQKQKPQTIGKHIQKQKPLILGVRKITMHVNNRSCTLSQTIYNAHTPHIVRQTTTDSYSSSTVLREERTMRKARTTHAATDFSLIAVLEHFHIRKQRTNLHHLHTTKQHYAL